MNVFISWSGKRSKTVAEALRDWLPKVLQSVDPWLSSADMDKGTKWSTEITSRLAKTDVGIVCLTPENLNAPWILFESGALSKAIEQARVCTYLFDLDPSNVQWPLAMFQSTKAEAEETKKLIMTLNKTMGDKALPEASLSETVDLWWPQLAERFKAVPPSTEQTKEQRTDRAILEEILQLVRSHTRSIAVDEWIRSLRDSLHNSGWGNYSPNDIDPRRSIRAAIDVLNRSKPEHPEDLPSPDPDAGH